MSDIFISYAKEDRERAAFLASALEEIGWSVFWDRTIPAGLTWREFIGRELKEARCVVVAWSRASVRSEWVLEEAEAAKRRKILVPVLIEGVDPPLGFGALQAADLTAWDGDTGAAEFQQLAGDLGRILSLPRKQGEALTAKPRVDKAKDVVRAEDRQPPGPAVAAFLKAHRGAALVAGLGLVLVIGWVAWNTFGGARWPHPGARPEQITSPGMYFLTADHAGAPLTELMFRIVDPSPQDPLEDDRPTSFDLHVEGACLVQDANRDDLLTWNHVGVCPN